MTRVPPRQASFPRAPWLSIPVSEPSELRRYPFLLCLTLLPCTHLIRAYPDTSNLYVAYSVSLSVNILDDTVIDASVVFFLGGSRAVVKCVFYHYMRPAALGHGYSISVPAFLKRSSSDAHFP